MANELKIFCGNATPQLALSVAQHLESTLGKITVATFSDGEIMVEINENVRGNDVFIVHSIAHPCNDNLMELMIMVDAFRRASAGRITAVIPYFGYARQDKRVRSARVAITAKVIADMLTGVGVNRVLTVDVHADQIQGFFCIPVDNVYATPLLVKHIMQQEYQNPLIVSPDVGGVVRARAFAKKLNTDLAIIDKRRPVYNVSEVINIIGDVADKTCIIIDDIIDTAGTLCNAAAALKQNGAHKVVAYCTHPVLSQNACAKIMESELDEVIVTDSIALSEAALKCSKIKQLSLASTLAEVIKRMRKEGSVSSMFAE